MKFALMIYGPDEPYQALDADKLSQMYAEHDRFGRLLRERGALVDGAELDYERRQIVPDGERRVITAGPYGETTEGVGGWYIVEVEDIDAAAELATHLPILPTDRIEVRAVK